MLMIFPCQNVVRVSLTAQQFEVVDEWVLPRCGQVFAYSTTQEQNEHHRCSDPEGAVQIRVALEYVEEVRTWEEGCPASL